VELTATTLKEVRSGLLCAAVAAGTNVGLLTTLTGKRQVALLKEVTSGGRRMERKRLDRNSSSR
jgi:hypothetical protein